MSAVAPIPRERPEPHVPHRHADHDGSKPCGCWLGDTSQQRVSCEWCGASYLRSEVVTFVHWRCYDCGMVYLTRMVMP